jgi:Asp-tRNA(Asn)/Glu-tRNA(Gln) amidotransferase A subunit family amidase
MADILFATRYYKTEIQGASSGILHGKSVAIKDCIPVAGVPMMNGSHLMDSFMPDFDATVVTRVLDAGQYSPCTRARHPGDTWAHLYTT